MNNAQAAIVEWQQKRITGTQLVRRLVAYDKWNLPISEAAAIEMLASNIAPRIQFNQSEDGKKRLLLYTDGESFNEGLGGKVLEQKQHFLTTAGTWVFQMPLEGFSEILINPGTKTFILYEGDQLESLRKIAAAVEIDGLLLKLRHGNGPDGSVRRVGDYPSFSIAIRNVNGHPTLCYAPDEQHRKLIAIFTANDAYDAYIARLPDGWAAETTQINLSGSQLFANLQQQPADGLVFNCCGPSQPVAFAHGLCAVILEELAK